MRTKPTNLTLSQETVKLLDEIKAARHLKTRSEAIRTLIREEWERREHPPIAAERQIVKALAETHHKSEREVRAGVLRVARKMQGSALGGKKVRP